jgi:hypothetical protein
MAHILMLTFQTQTVVTHAYHVHGAAQKHFFLCSCAKIRFRKKLHKHDTYLEHLCTYMQC